MPDTPINIVEGEYESACEHCGWQAKVRLALGANLQVGDRVYRTTEDPFFGKCRKCQRYSMKVTKTPSKPVPAPPRGFWKIPTE